MSKRPTYEDLEQRIRDLEKSKTIKSKWEDIERKQMDRRLRNSEKRSSLWLQNSPICTKILDLDFKALFYFNETVSPVRILTHKALPYTQKLSMRIGCWQKWAGRLSCLTMHVIDFCEGYLTGCQCALSFPNKSCTIGQLLLILQRISTNEWVLRESGQCFCINTTFLTSSASRIRKLKTK